MADERLPFLCGRITQVDIYQSPQGGGGKRTKLPSLEPNAHRKRLLEQLDAIDQRVKTRDEAARDELASREIVAVRPAPDTQLAPDQLDDARADARLVGVVPETGTVLLDVANPHLDHLRKKIDNFADDTKIKTKTLKDGSMTTRRSNELAVAPVETVALANLDDVRGPRLRAETLIEERAYWLEIGCRGGYRGAGRCQPSSGTSSSRSFRCSAGGISVEVSKPRR